jgi:hypothetical protein
MDIQPLEILKWIGIVLAAGFIGYFGRYLAMLIINGLRKKKLDVKIVESDASEQQATINHGNIHKLEEKRLKQETKRVKKAAK